MALQLNDVSYDRDSPATVGFSTSYSSQRGRDGVLSAKVD